MNSLESFNYFLNNKISIKIPQIQRDYAEGRQVDRIPEIRKTLLGEMVSVAFGQKKSTELDFVYGYTNHGYFEPLDGQQRLTTLFLLYWFLGSKGLLLQENGDSILTYVNRESTKDFCAELVKRESLSSIIEYKCVSAKSYSGKTFGDFIKESGWFRWNWNYDPSIQSMIVVLSDIYDLFKGEDTRNFTIYLKNLENIKFRFLDLNAFNMGDELYIKMNARGKELSSFDLLKSFLERDLAINCTDPSLIIKWKSSVDCDWMDYFWWKYYQNEKKSVSEVEFYFEVTLRWLIWCQLVKQCNIKVNFEKLKPKNFIQDGNAYKDFLKQYTINYETLIRDFYALFSLDGSKVYSDINKFNNKKNLAFTDSLLQEVIDKCEYDSMLFLYAQIKWIGLISSFDDMNKKSNSAEEFIIWMRFIRNMFTIGNGGSARIDSVSDFSNAERWVDSILQDYVGKKHTIGIRNYINNIAFTSGCSYLQTSLDEEKEKISNISKDPSWETSIIRAEDNFYLTGQINVLLYAASNNLRDFNNYLKYFELIFDGTKESPISADHSIKLHQLLLIERPYNLYTKNGSLLESNQHRDYSLKRYFRDNVETRVLDAMKTIMHIWDKKYSHLNFDNFHSKYVNNSSSTISGFPYWRQFLIYNKHWDVSLCKINKHYFTMLDENSNILYVHRNGSTKEEIIIGHIHGIVRLTNGLTLLDDQCGELRVSFLDDKNIEFRVECEGYNYYSLYRENNVQLSKTNYKNVLKYLNVNIKNIF